MFTNKLKRPALALAVTAALLAVAGPASAATSGPPSLVGDGNEVVVETAKVWNGDGTDTAVKGVMTWNPGEGTDVVAGPTSAEVVTNNDPDRLKAPKSFVLDIGTTETLDLNTAASHHEITHESVTLAVNGRSVDAPFDLSIASSEVFELKTNAGDDSVEVWAPGDGSGQVAGSAGLKFDSNEWAEETFSGIDTSEASSASPGKNANTSFSGDAYINEMGIRLGSNDKLEAPLSFGLSFEHVDF